MMSLFGELATTARFIKTPQPEAGSACTGMKMKSELLLILRDGKLRRVVTLAETAVGTPPGFGQQGNRVAHIKP